MPEARRKTALGCLLLDHQRLLLTGWYARGGDMTGEVLPTLAFWPPHRGYLRTAPDCHSWEPEYRSVRYEDPGFFNQEPHAWLRWLVGAVWSKAHMKYVRRSHWFSPWCVRLLTGASAILFGKWGWQCGKNWANRHNLSRYISHFRMFRHAQARKSSTGTQVKYVSGRCFVLAC